LSSPPLLNYYRSKYPQRQKHHPLIHTSLLSSCLLPLSLLLLGPLPLIPLPLRHLPLIQTSLRQPPVETTPSDFWEVFVPELPNVPLSEDLICRLIGMHYPKGILSDQEGNALPGPAPHIQMVIRALGSTTTGDDTKVDEYLDSYPWREGEGALRLTLKADIMRVQAKVKELLKWGDLEKLDELYWTSFKTASEEGVADRNWPPFSS
ncbi:hypothetical protein F5Y17DRAFT_471292, partial [Xylariaceae sp. FL0594]